MEFFLAFGVFFTCTVFCLVFESPMSRIFITMAREFVMVSWQPLTHQPWYYLLAIIISTGTSMILQFAIMINHEVDDSWLMRCQAIITNSGVLGNKDPSKIISIRICYFIIKLRSCWSKIFEMRNNYVLLDFNIIDSSRNPPGKKFFSPPFPVPRGAKFDGELASLPSGSAEIVSFHWLVKIAFEVVESRLLLLGSDWSNLHSRILNFIFTWKFTIENF